MQLTLRAHPASLSAAAINHADPLRILRILNHVPDWAKCSIVLRKPTPEETRLTFKFYGVSRDDNLPQLLHCLDGVVPEVFDCDSLTITDPSAHRLPFPRAALDKTNDSLLLPVENLNDAPSRGFSSLTLTNYHRPYVLPQFSSPDEVVRRLRADTFLDCGNTLLGSRRVELSLVSPGSRTVQRVAFNRRMQRTLEQRNMPRFRILHQFEQNAVLVDLLLWSEVGASAASRVQTYAETVPVGLASVNTRAALIARLQKPLDKQSHKYFGASLEINAPASLLTYDLDYRAVADTPYRDLLGLLTQWLDEVSEADDVQILYRRADDLRDSDMAQMLLQRQARMQASPMVFVTGEPVLQEPKSENDVLALYFKLEGAKALPMHTCRVLEHTPARGTDAIGHFRIDASDALNQFALIEFEHRFANFLAHGHSLRHVDLIICWSASLSDPLTGTDRPWLRMYADSRLHRAVPVVVLNQIPHLEVRSA